MLAFLLVGQDEQTEQVCKNRITSGCLHYARAYILIHSSGAFVFQTRRKSFYVLVPPAYFFLLKSLKHYCGGKHDVTNRLRSFWQLSNMLSDVIIEPSSFAGFPKKISPYRNAEIVEQLRTRTIGHY